MTLLSRRRGAKAQSDTITPVVLARTQIAFRLVNGRADETGACAIARAAVASRVTKNENRKTNSVTLAPGWAHFGRCHRVIGKFIEGTHDSDECAEEAFRRALGLDPRLTVADKFYAYLESDMGHAARAMVRLLGEANRHGNDAELFAGLAHTCRYCGLFDESIAADLEARRLDPNVATNLQQTLVLTGDLERLLALDAPPVGGGDAATRVIALGLAGRRDEARRLLTELRQAVQIPTFQWWSGYLMAWLDRRPAW